MTLSLKSKGVSGLSLAAAIISSASSDAATPRKAVPAKHPATAITSADIRAAGIAVGFDVKQMRVVNACDEPVEAPQQQDLNGDGQKELIFGEGGACVGNAGAFHIARKDQSGEWIGILSSPGVYEILKVRQSGWPDIQSGGPGCSGSDPRYSFRNGKYQPSGSQPRSCTTGSTKPTQPSIQRASLPSSIQYTGFTGSERYPVWNDFKVTHSAGNIGGSAFMQIGIFSGDAPITGTYAEGGCSITRKKQTFRGICNETEFSGTIYDTKDKPGETFRFISNAELARLEANRDAGQSASGSASAQPVEPATVNSGVWSLGRARFLVEPRGGCGPEASLGTKSYCFNQAMDWLRRHPDRQSVDVVAMQNAWLPGSFVPHNSGQGWNIYKVSKQGDAFTASKQSHYGTKVQVPQGCIYAGVAGQAWYIAIARRGKVAVEAANYACSNPWAGQPIYAANLNTQDIDGAPGEIQIAEAPGQSGQNYDQQAGGDQPARYPNGKYSDSADWGGPLFKQNWQSGTSAVIHGEPDADAPTTKPKAKKKR